MNQSDQSNGHSRQTAMSTEDVFAHDDKMAEQAPATPTGITQPDTDGSVGDVNRTTKIDIEKYNNANAVQDIRRSSRYDKDLQKVTQQKKIDFKTAELNQGNILPSLRRSNRSNKGVSKEMFDPSHIPSPKHKIYTNMNNIQESTDKNENSSDSSDSKSLNKTHHGAKKERSVSREIVVEEEKDVEPEESDSDSDDDAYNDPNKLWCICKKPHNGRFMISCDLCEEWFHGDCVGVTVQRGKQMEKKGEEYVCPACLGNKGKKVKHRQNSEQESKSKSGVKLKGYAHDKNEKQKHFLKKRKSREHDSKHPENKTQNNSQSHTRSVKSRNCIVASCHNKAQSDSVYCSNVCILRHAKESIGGLDSAKQSAANKVHNRGKQESKEERILRKIKEAASHGKVAVMCRKTGKIFANASAPLKEDLNSFLKKNSTFHLLRPLKILKRSSEPVKEVTKPSKNHHQKRPSNTSVYQRDGDYKPEEKRPSNPYKHLTPTTVHSSESHKAKKHKIGRQESHDGKKSKHKRHDSDRRHSFEKNTQKFTPSKRDGRSLSDEKNDSKKDAPNEKEVRRNVRNSLLGILQNRSNNSDDLKMHSDSITRLVNKIEDSLHKLFGSVSFKYKNRYRSIMFNLKDEKNHGLWRKVILGEVTSSSLVKMTAEEMASKELAQWREHELTQELEMIHELETAKKNIRPISKITHKGEIAINEDYSDLTESHLDTSHERIGPSIAPQRIRRISSNQSDSLIEPNPLAVDTTLEHNNHLFDMNCRICTGQMKEENVHLEGSNSKKVKSSTSIIMSNEAQATAGVDQSDDDILKKISAFSKKKEKPFAIPSIIEKDDDENSTEEKPQEKEEEIKEPKETSPVIKKEPPSTKLGRDRFIWSGVVSMPELSSFRTNAYTVSGSAKELVNSIPNKLVLDGRIHPKVVWEYLDKVRSFSNKEVCVIQFRASSEEDRAGYVSMLSYFSSRRRFGVVSNQNTQVIKDIYLVPLLETEKVPEQLLPFRGPGIPTDHPSMLLGVIVRCIFERKKTPDIDFQPTKFEEKQPKRSKISEDDSLRKSLLDRNRLLTSAMPHFTQKDVKEEEEEEYNPETADFESITDEDVPEPNSPDDDDEAYDPEKLVFDNDTKDEDDVPYDPEVEAKRLENTELKALQEKQAFLEKMKRELDMKKAELAKEEMTLQKQAPPPPPPLPIKSAAQNRIDPRMAARMHKNKTTNNNNVAQSATETPLQKIFSVLNFDKSKPS